MDLGLKGRVAFVTGCGGKLGFGRAICLQLAEEGCKVIGAGRSLEGVAETVRLVEEKGGAGLATVCDVRFPEQVEAAVKQGIDQFGRIDIVINNAGASSSHFTNFIDMTQDEIKFDVDVNLYGQMNVVKAILPYMMEHKYGRIVNFAGGRGIPGISVYGAAKSAVIDWTAALASEVAPFGIYANTFGPGLSRTGLVQGAPEAFLQAVTQTTRQKRLCTPEDVSNLVVFLASERNSYMTGEFIHI